MLHHYQSSAIFLIIFTFWILNLFMRSFDKTLRKYIIAIGASLIFWMILIIIKSSSTETLRIFVWYLYYVPLIAIPTFYYNCSDYFSNNGNKIKRHIIIGISTLLILFVLTNNFHQLVFELIDGDDEYIHKVGYYAICIWIFALLIISIIKLAKIAINQKDKKKIVIPFIPVLVGLAYTVIYLLNFGLVRDINLSIVIGILFCIGLESFYRLKFIPNNLKYKKIFVNSALPIEIISEDGSTVISSKHSIDVEEKIISDIKNKRVKAKYNDENKIQHVKAIYGGYAVEESDLTKLNKLKQELNEKNKELIKQEALLENQKKIKSKIFEAKLKNEIIESLDEKINDKKAKINKMLDEMDENDYEKMQEIKLLISYCKRMSSLVISDYNEEKYNNKRIEIIINELLIELKSSDINGIIQTNNFEISSHQALCVYEIVFEVLANLKNIDCLLNIEIIDNNIVIKFVFDKKIDNIKKNLENLNIRNIQIEEKIYEEETKLEVKINIKGEK